jgi:hypothetical protein
MKADETKRAMDQVFAQWRESKSFSFPLNDEGRVARLEDARTLGRILSAKLLMLIDLEPVMSILLMLDPQETAFLFQLGTVAHMMTCDDPKCTITHPKDEEAR